MDKIARELEWRYDDFQSIWTADTPIGDYQAWEIAGHGCYRPPGWVPKNVDGGLPGAKAAAQAYFEKLVQAVVSPAFIASPQQLEEARAAHKSLKELTIKRSTRMNAAESKALMLEAELWDAREALKPFANCVFSDNADVTINSSQLCAGDFLRAAIALSLAGKSEVKP